MQMPVHEGLEVVQREVGEPAPFQLPGSSTEEPVNYQNYPLCDVHSLFIIILYKRLRVIIRQVSKQSTESALSALHRWPFSCHPAWRRWRMQPLARTS